ncbi:class I SAM-dependent methyltransferase [Marimonas sp. MJW-29]|uniref:Class I SAM-dependent methyltransferase n=1 Tax=Sulfitobacter sediminis TaxID=3234186 RepID=A0ABV3RSM3_9RHOB
MADRDQRAFWTEEAGPKWVARMAAMDATLQPVLDLMLDSASLTHGAHVLDIGCGAGTSTLEASMRVGDGGSACGADISRTLLGAARDRAGGLANVSFLLADAQSHRFEANRFDRMISRFGTMFFEDFSAAFANIARALKPNGTMTFVTWGAIPENAYFTLPARVARQELGAAPKSNPDDPGPFALREADRVQSILADAGLSEPQVEEVRLDLTPKGDALAVAELLCEIGPAQKALDHFKATPPERARLTEAIARALEPHATPDGIRLPALINLCTARKAA